MRLFTGKTLTVQSDLENGNSSTTIDDSIAWSVTEGEEQGVMQYKSGSQLKQYQDAEQTLSYTYDADGIRTTKTIADADGNTVTKKYYLDGSNILAEQVSGLDDTAYTIWYAYG